LAGHGFYILIFLNSRRIDPKAFTVGLPEHEQGKMYHHPTYLRDASRYQEEFNCYSLGLVLLEIGHLESLSTLTATWKGSREDLRNQLLTRKMPQLSALVGEHYQDAVEACLTGKFKSANAEEWDANSALLYHSFWHFVIERLSKYPA
jgi:hypothetical protein